MTGEIDWTKAAGREKTPRPKHLSVETEDDDLIMDDIKFEIEERHFNYWKEAGIGLIIVGIAIGVLYLVFNWNSIFPPSTSSASDVMGLVLTSFPLFILIAIAIFIVGRFKRYI